MADISGPSISEAVFHSSSSPFGWGFLSSWNLIQRDRLECETAEVGSATRVGSVEFPTLFACADGSHIFEFEDVARFRVCFSDQTVALSDVAADASSEALTHLLFDHVAPRILAGSDRLVIHASAVEINGSLAVFLGDTGAGKSTLAASLDKAGHRLIGDDALLVSVGDDEVSGRSVYPSLRLYPETISTLLGDVETTPMAHYSEKQRLQVAPDADAKSEPLPIGAVFFLIDELSENEVAVDALPPTLTCMGLVEHSFALNPEDAASAARRLAEFSKFAARVPGYELSYPWNFDLLPEVHEKVLSVFLPASARSLSEADLGEVQ